MMMIKTNERTNERINPRWRNAVYDMSSVGGFYMAIGTSGNQFKNAGVAGALMADLVESVEDRGLDHDTKPLQFEMTRTRKGTIDTGAFSRRRNPHATSGNVMG